MILKYINIPVFIISFIIGLFCINFVKPEVKTIYVYPTPENFNKVIYKDNAKSCHQFYPIEVKCPINPLLINNIPIQ